MLTKLTTAAFVAASLTVTAPAQGTDKTAEAIDAVMSANREAFHICVTNADMNRRVQELLWLTDIENKGAGQSPDVANAEYKKAVSVCVNDHLVMGIN